MRDYGKVYTAFWTSDDVQAMTEDERTLALYLLTCPHGNMLGCFRLPNAYASEDLKWAIERISEGFAGLASKGYLDRCERSSWLVIKRYLKWNQFENPNVGKAACKMFSTLAAPEWLKASLVEAMREFSPDFSAPVIARFDAENKTFLNHSDTLREPFDTQCRNQSQPEPEPEPEPEPQPEPKALSSKNPLDPSLTIFEYWQKAMDSPRSVLDAKRISLIKRALKNYSPAEICKAIRGCTKSPWHMGENDRKTIYNGLGLILRDAERIDSFIGLDAGAARAGPETIEQTNARLMAEFLGEDRADDDNTIDMEP